MIFRRCKPSFSAESTSTVSFFWGDGVCDMVLVAISLDSTILLDISEHRDAAASEANTNAFVSDDGCFRSSFFWCLQPSFFLRHWVNKKVTVCTGNVIVVWFLQRTTDSSRTSFADTARTNTVGVHVLLSGVSVFSSVWSPSSCVRFGMVSKESCLIVISQDV